MNTVTILGISFLVLVPCAETIVCPSPLTVGWRHRPPYVHRSDSGNVTGFLNKGMQDVFQQCCGYNSPEYIFEDLTSSEYELLEHSHHILLPVTRSHLQVSAQTQRFNRKYLPFMQASGVVNLIQMEEMIPKNAIVASVLAKGWPLVVLVFLFAIYGGIIIWALESVWNQNEFPRRAVPGIWEGFWWSIVTMTTIGYGDRTPRSVAGRLFSVIHIVFGIVVCSFFTAAVTAVISIDTRASYTDNKRFAVLQDSPEIAFVMEQNGIPLLYSSLSDAVSSLSDLSNHLQGLMVEKAQWSAYRELYPSAHLQVTQQYRHPSYHGLYVNQHLEDDLWACLEERATTSEHRLARDLHNATVNWSKSNVIKKGQSEHQTSQLVMGQVFSFSGSVVPTAIGFAAVWILLYGMAIIVQGLYYRSHNQSFFGSFTCLCLPKTDTSIHSVSTLPRLSAMESGGKAYELEPSRDSVYSTKAN